MTSHVDGTQTLDVSVAERMNSLPITPLHRKVVLLVGLGMFFDLYEIFLAGVLGTVLLDEFSLPESYLKYILSASFIGMFIGAITLGRLADSKLGRRRAFLFNLGIYSFFTFLGAFSPNVGFLMVTRMLAGLGLGAELPLADAYLGDLLPARKRGRYTAWAFTLCYLSVPFIGFLAHFLVPLNPLGVSGWRWLFVIGSLGAVIVLALRRKLPESPRWLEATGRNKEADEVLERFEAEAPDQAMTTSATDDGSSREAGAVRTQRNAQLGSLLVPPFRRRTLMLVFFQLLQTCGYYGFGTLVPVVLAEKGYDIVDSLLFVGVTFIGYPIGSLISVFLMEAVERKFLIVGGALGMAAFGMGFAFSTSVPAILGFGFLYTLMSNIFANGFHVYQAEIFPTTLRATAASWTYSISRLSTAIMPFALVPLLSEAGSVALFSALAVIMVLVALDIGIFGPRTTGRALEEVNA